MLLEEEVQRLVSSDLSAEPMLPTVQRRPGRRRSLNDLIAEPSYDATETSQASLTADLIVSKVPSSKLVKVRRRSGDKQAFAEVKSQAFLDEMGPRSRAAAKQACGGGSPSSWRCVESEQEPEQEPEERAVAEEGQQHSDEEEFKLPML